jgi:uncharacterized iron-regulated membrane protein
MCVTGALIAYERNIIEFSERDARYTTEMTSDERLPISAVLQKVMGSRPEARLSSVSLTNEPNAAWQINLGREGVVYAHPQTGELIGEGNKAVRGFMSGLRDWHRWIALSGEHRPVGKAITGAANLIFLLLAISGIYIWFPRKIAWKMVRPVIWFRGGVRGKARNFNWHNTIGFWSSLFLIVFTLTATVISYQWASNLLYTLTGNEAPQQNGGSAQPQEPPGLNVPAGLDPAWSAAVGAAPEWKSISLRLPVTKDSAVFTIDEGIYWNIFGRSTLTVDLATAAQKWEPYREQNAARQLRSWFRFTHTGETGGMIGQTIGFAACIGGAFLVWTGFALALRRARNWVRRRNSGVLDNTLPNEA